MSRQNERPRNGITLPFALQKELGLEEPRTGGGRGRGGGVQQRKEQRKADRFEKRQNTRGSRPQRRFEVDAEDDDCDRGRSSAIKTYTNTNTKAASQSTAVKKSAAKVAPRKDEQTPRSILKKPKRHLPPPSPSPSLSEASSPPSWRSTSPGLVLDASSHAFRERAAQDDAAISALEKRLGLGKGKSSNSFADDGLDDLLEGLDDDEEEHGVKRQRKSEGEEWLERKRRKTMAEQEGSEDDLELEEESGLDEGSEEDLSDLDFDSDLEEDIQDDADQFDGFTSEDEEARMPPPPKKRENPYVAPVSDAPTKYIPPSLRKPQSGGPSLERLKRQIQGHLNKLSEANLVSILGEIEKVYQTNPRQDVTSVLIELLLTPFFNKATLQNTFVILHAAFAAAVYKVVGVDFGAELVSQLVDRFDEYHSNADAGKESLNLISLLSNLFTFHVIGGALVFDHITLLLEKLTENNTELLLRLVRDCGPQLRQDDPSSLKTMVQMMQKEAARMNVAGEQMSVRTKFMIETMTDLKNNKMKAATNNAGLSSEHITQMRKTLGSLNSRTLRGSEPLRISRDDLQNIDKKGKWWLVGASWKGNDASANTPDKPDESPVQAQDLLEDDSIDLLSLSRQYGMNTDVRRSIFVALLSAVDYQDAHVRLLKLRLKRSQEQEIPKVLLRCAAGESPYNHYYTLVAKRLCQDRRMRKAFQFALWGFFRRMGENAAMDDEGGEDNGEEEEENISMPELANLAKLYAHLILDGAETIGVLKVLDLAYIKERTTMFVELLLLMLMTESKSVNKRSSSLDHVFARAAETPQIVKRLQYFIKKNVRGSDLVAEADRAMVKRGCKVALDTLAQLGSVGMLDE